jgi:putative DNA primase/helicase
MAIWSRPPRHAVARSAESPSERELSRLVSAIELLRLELSSHEPIIDPILSWRGLAMLHGPRGLGKSQLALSLAFAASCGGSALAHWSAPQPRRVLFVDGELPVRMLRDRVAALAEDEGPRTANANLRFLSADLLGGALPDPTVPENQERLERAWGNLPELMVLDNFHTLGGEGRARDLEAWTSLQRWLLSLRRRGVSVLLVHQDGWLARRRGGAQHEDILDTVIALRRPADYASREGARFEVRVEKGRGLYGAGAAWFEASLSTEEGKCRWTTRPLEDVQLTAAAALFDARQTVRVVARELGISRSVAGRLRKQALQAGLFSEPSSVQPGISVKVA